MMNVLLVDDEPWVLEGLRTIVNWSKYGFKVCGEAANGNTAWAMIEELQPDVVFTDIHMPAVSGLELIDRSMHELTKPPRFVILSGHDNFEYARAALKQQVEDYLLKPIDEDEIELVLKQMSQKIQNELASESLYRLERSLYVNRLVNRLLQGEFSEQLNDEAEALLMIKGDEEVACVLIETELKEEQLKEIIAELITPTAPELFSDSEGRLGLIVPNSLCSIDELELLGSKIYEACPQEVPIIVAVGHSTGGVASLHLAYQKALSALGWKRYHNREGIIDFNDLSHSYAPKEMNKQVNKEALSTLMEAINGDESDHIEAAVDALLAAPLSRIPSSDEEYVRLQLLSLEMGILKKLKELGGNVDQFVQRIQQSLGKLTEINSYSEFHQYAVTLSLIGFETLRKQRKQSENNTLFHVIQYVNQEFREKLQLQELAQKFHMNPNYLGQVFKQETGKSFREYLNDKRIEEAKRLLRQGRQSISEVAANSGYPNTDYFVSQFKRMTGVAPSAYRKQEKSEYIDG